MKKLVTFALVIVSMCVLTSSTYSDTYCEGFYNGFKNGYCHNQGFSHCMTPPPPLCPIPRINEDTYTHGYNRGLLAGLNY